MVRFLPILIGCILVAAPAGAQTIVGAKSAVINSGGPGSGDIADTYNQNGLSTGYVSGVTNFDSYIAGDPRHTASFFGYEWFSNQGTSTASVTYDLGSVFGLDRLAYWNEEAAGVGVVTLLGSLDGASFSDLGSFTPTDQPQDAANYGADVFSFATISARYVRFDLSRCPQPDGFYSSCAIGEVAFRTATVEGAVPEPATWLTMILGFGVAGAALRRRRIGGLRRSVAIS